MQCAICRHGQTQPGTATVTLERGEVTVVIKHVPAQVCANCGEEYFDEAITEQLLALLDHAARTGVQVEVREYVAA